MNEDSPVPLSELLAHRRLLEQLALRMTGDREGAEELVQEAWLVALQRPPRHADNLTAWLRGVLRHLRYRSWRRAARTRSTELDPALPAESAPAAEVLERAEIAAEVARLVLKLEEPYRSVLILRFYENRTPTEIGALLDRPVNTVVSQIARGLVRLRDRLGSEHGDEASHWSGAWILLDWRRWSRRPASFVEAPDAPPRHSRFAGLSSSKAMLAGAVVLLSLALFVWRASWSRAERSSDFLAAASPTNPRPREEVPINRAREPLDLGTAPVAIAAGLEVEVVDDSGEPLAGASLEVTRAVEAADGLRNSQRIQYAPGGETDARGRLRFPLDTNVVAWETHHGEDSAWSQVDWIGLRLSKEGLFKPYYHLLFPSAEGCSVRVRLPERSVVLRGHVSDVEGRPLSAGLYFDFERLPELQSDGSLLLENPRTVEVDAQGRYDASLLPSGFHTLWIRRHGYVPHVDWMDGKPRTALERDFVLHRGIQLVGTVLDAEGAPVEGAHVHAQYQDNVIPFQVVTCSNAGFEGDYEITGIRPGWVLATAVHPEDPSLYDAAFLDLSAAQLGEWVPELRQREPLRACVRTSEGHALGGCVVRVTRPDASDDWSSSTTSDAGGCVTIPRLPSGAALDIEVFPTLADFIAGAPPCVSTRGAFPGPQVGDRRATRASRAGDLDGPPGGRSGRATRSHAAAPACGRRIPLPPDSCLRGGRHFPKGRSLQPALRGDARLRWTGNPPARRARDRLGRDP